MRKGPVVVSLFLMIALAILCGAEDRIETIKAAKGSKELVYRNDSLAEDRSFDSSGGLIEERSFGADSLPLLTSKYFREGGRLLKVESSDASGTVTGTRFYHYDNDGRLLMVATEGSFGAGAAGMVSAGGTPQGSWTEAGSTVSVLGYDESGRAVVIQTVKEGKTVSIERRIYGETGSLSSIAIEDKASGSSSELLYDAKGRQSQRRQIPAKGAEMKTQYRYDESGRLSEEYTRAGIHTTSVRRTYAESGSLARIETRRDGELLLAIEYIENGRTEELYENGILFVKATYFGGRKIQDEFYSDGAIVRSRDYK